MPLWKSTVKFLIEDVNGNRKTLTLINYWDVPNITIGSQLQAVEYVVNWHICNFTNNQSTAASDPPRTILNVSGVEISRVYNDSDCGDVIFDPKPLSTILNFQNTILPSGFNVSELRKQIELYEVEKKNGEIGTFKMTAYFPTSLIENFDKTKDYNYFVFPIIPPPPNVQQARACNQFKDLIVNYKYAKFKAD